LSHSMKLHLSVRLRPTLLVAAHYVPGDALRHFTAMSHSDLHVLTRPSQPAWPSAGSERVDCPNSVGRKGGKSAATRGKPLPQLPQRPGRRVCRRRITVMSRIVAGYPNFHEGPIWRVAGSGQWEIAGRSVGSCPLRRP